MHLLSFSFILYSLDILLINTVNAQNSDLVQSPSIKQFNEFLAKLKAYQAIYESQAQYSDLPPPPKPPSVFTSIKQVNEYLIKLMAYQAITTREKFGKRSAQSISNDNLSNKRGKNLHEIFKKHQNEQLCQPVHIYTINEANSRNNKKILKILQSYTEGNGINYTIPTIEFSEFFDTNKDGYTTIEELQNFINYCCVKMIKLNCC